MSYLSQSKSRRIIAEMNMVPFIDVILVLLVIFMITTPLLTQGVKVDLPKTEAKAIPPEQKEPLIVTVDSNGNYYLNTASKPEEPITARVLTNLVQTQLASADPNQEQRPVLVRGDKSVNYGKVVEAMVLLQQAGAVKVGLMTEPTEQHAAK
jgi:biopolymer transport protein TolR